MHLRGLQWIRDRVMAMIAPVTAAAMAIIAAPLLAPSASQAASQTEKSVVIVKQAAEERKGAATGHKIRRLIMADLARRGHDVHDGDTTPTVPGATVLRVAADLRVLHGTYTTRASIDLRAKLVDGETKRILAQFDLGSQTPWRLAAHCPKNCIDFEVQRRIRPLAARISDDVNRRLVRLGRDRIAAAVRKERVSVAFRRVDRSLLPRIEQYLRNFPGVTRIRRDDSAGNGVRYRLSHDGAARGTELSLRKMLHHLPLEARIVRTGNSYIVEAEKAAEPAAGSPNW